MLNSPRTNGKRRKRPLRRGIYSLFLRRLRDLRAEVSFSFLREAEGSAQRSHGLPRTVVYPGCTEWWCVQGGGVYGVYPGRSSIPLRRGFSDSLERRRDTSAQRLLSLPRRRSNISAQRLLASLGGGEIPLRRGSSFFFSSSVSALSGSFCQFCLLLGSCTVFRLNTRVLSDRYPVLH